MPPVAIVEAPSGLGLIASGVEQLPDALRDAGLAARLGAEYAGRVDPGARSHTRDAETRFLNANAIRDYTLRVSAEIGEVFRSDRFPVVIGGDCSILPGCMLAARRQGHRGLLFLDGHMDFYDGESNVNGEVASSELALVTGRGPALLTNFDGTYPLAADEDVVAFGFRDEAEAQSYGSPPLPRAMKSYSLSAIRRLGVEVAAEMAVNHLNSAGFWIHFDVDVLNDDVMPAVDYRMPDGLHRSEMEAILSAALRSGAAVGMNITILNPTLDVDGASVENLMEILARVRPGN